MLHVLLLMLLILLHMLLHMLLVLLLLLQCELPYLKNECSKLEGQMDKQWEGEHVGTWGRGTCMRDGRGDTGEGHMHPS